MYNENSISSSHDEKNHQYVINCFKRIKNFIEKSSNKKELMPMLYNRLLYVIVTTAISGYFNPSNQENFKIKKRKYKEYLNNDLIKEALKKASWRGVGLERKLILLLIKFNCFRIIDFLAFIRKKQKKG